MDNENNNPRFNDDYFNVVSLPMDKQRPMTAEDRKAFFNDLRARILGEVKDDVTTLNPLTTDVYARGYPALQPELDTIAAINEQEKKILLENPDAKGVEGFRYFIVEDGRVFKTSDFASFYGLDMTSMQWELDQKYIEILNGMLYKFSELKNFRDYYPTKEMDKEFGGFPR